MGTMTQTARSSPSFHDDASDSWVFTTFVDDSMTLSEEPTHDTTVPYPSYNHEPFSHPHSLLPTSWAPSPDNLPAVPNGMRSSSRLDELGTDPSTIRPTMLVDHSFAAEYSISPVTDHNILTPSSTWDSSERDDGMSPVSQNRFLHSYAFVSADSGTTYVQPDDLNRDPNFLAGTTGAQHVSSTPSTMAFSDGTTHWPTHLTGTAYVTSENFNVTQNPSTYTRGTMDVTMSDFMHTPRNDRSWSLFDAQSNTRRSVQDSATPVPMPQQQLQAFNQGYGQLQTPWNSATDNYQSISYGQINGYGRGSLAPPTHPTMSPVTSAPLHSFQQQAMLPTASFASRPERDVLQYPFSADLPHRVVPSQRQATHPQTQPGRQQPVLAPPTNRPVGPIRSLQPLAQAHRSQSSAVQYPATNRKGGRKKGEQLDPMIREKSKRIRQISACWHCRFQRDECGEGSPCKRCLQKWSKGQLKYIECDRTKLHDLVHEFLPPSMTLMHQKEGIMNTVNEQVIRWDTVRPINVSLTSGYGEPLVWEMCQFHPASNDLLGQFQYIKGVRERKYSPPLGLLKLDAADDHRVKDYLDVLLQPCNLDDFGWTFFEEDSLLDEDMFQAKLLDQMCKLYMATTDQKLKSHLRGILEMLIITYIMSHTLTICETELPAVLNHVNHRPDSRDTQLSPRLANRQLKFYFSVLRHKAYTDILKWQHGILYNSGKKEVSWLASFCSILSLAMVLEEVQHTIMIQADAKITKQELPTEVALREAQLACQRIDERFDLLVGLFQCKYRDKTWGDGSFGNGTPQFSDLAADSFLRHVLHILREKKDHLEARKNVTFALPNRCYYTSRLVARFLLPFLGLP